MTHQHLRFFANFVSEIKLSNGKRLESEGVVFYLYVICKYVCVRVCACRSVYGGFAKWEMGVKDDGSGTLQCVAVCCRVVVYCSVLQ